MYIQKSKRNDLLTIDKKTTTTKSPTYTDFRKTYIPPKRNSCKTAFQCLFVIMFKRTL